jgi:tetratricopeptide (TPR) repeat protein
MVAGLAAMAVEEFFDFNLQVPASAFLFTIFAALTVRLTSAKADRVIGERARRRTKRIAVTSAVTSAGLIVASATQGQTNYPYNIGTPATPAAARTILLTYPTTWYSHVVASQMFGPCSPRGLEEQSIAVRLDPTNPAVRDAYSANLSCAGRENEALEQMTNSVLFSPDVGTHWYLLPEKIVAATAQERSAVERGLTVAAARQYSGAAGALGAYYDALGRYSEEGAILARAGASETDERLRLNYLLAAGTAYARAQAWAPAEDSFRKAARAEPDDPTPIEDLVDLVFGPKRDFQSAKAVVEDAVNNGADPYPLWMDLARVLSDKGRGDEAEKYFRDALNLHPADFDALFQLGLLYRQEGRFNQAIISLRRATEVRPSSAEAYFHLAVAEEDDFDYPAAEHDYSVATSLEPDNAGLKSQFEEFKRKVAANSPKAERPE